MKQSAVCPCDDSRSRIGKTASLIGIVCNVLLFALKLTAGLLSGALGVTADALNNLSDATGSVVALLGFKLSEKPADERHPYGHARLEYIAGMVVGALILVVGFELLKSSIEKMVMPQKPVFSTLTVVVLVVSILVKGGLFVFNRILAKRIDSAVLKATAADSRNDVLITLSVLIAYLCEPLCNRSIDGMIGLLVAAFILYSGVRLIMDIIHPLLGTAGSPALRRMITDTVTAQPHVLGVHDLLVHDYGPSHCYASVHVEMDCEDDPMHCHEILDRIERECLAAHGVHLVIHYDPVVRQDPETDRLRARVQGVLRCFDVALSMHDFRVSRQDGQTVLCFDVSLPDRLYARREEIILFLHEAFNGHDKGNYAFSVMFDPDEPKE